MVKYLRWILPIACMAFRFIRWWLFMIFHYFPKRNYHLTYWKFISQIILGCLSHFFVEMKTKYCTDKFQRFAVTSSHSISIFRVNLPVIYRCGPVLFIHLLFLIAFAWRFAYVGETYEVSGWRLREVLLLIIFIICLYVFFCNLVGFHA